MNTLDAIAQRRSIRMFKPDPVPEEQIRQVLEAGRLAPSAKNRQPWRFVVLRGDASAHLVELMGQGIAFLEGQGMNTGSARNTARIMAGAPVNILLFNPMLQGEGTIWDLDAGKGQNLDRSIGNFVDVQSVGAAIQNMCLAAVELGLGTLWIGDIFVAYNLVCQWLDTTDQLVAALALGYPDESPGARPRKVVDEITEWR